MVIGPSLSFFLPSAGFRSRDVESLEVSANQLGSKRVIGTIRSVGLVDETALLGSLRRMQLRKSSIIYSDTKVPEASQQCKRLRVSFQICSKSKQRAGEALQKAPPSLFFPLLVAEVV